MFIVLISLFNFIGYLFFFFVGGKKDVYSKFMFEFIIEIFRLWDLKLLINFCSVILLNLKWF